MAEPASARLGLDVAEGRGASPRILLVATSRWATTARLAKAFASAGCAVEVVCPRGHPVRTTRAAAAIHPYHVFAPLRSLDGAIRAARPDLIVPCDDLARSHMIELLERGLPGEGGHARRAALEDSLGEAASLAATTTRSGQIALARELGIRVPATAVALTRDAVRRWVSEKPGPWVLKTDGSYGGGGVRVVHSAEEAERTWQHLYVAPSLRHAMRRAIVNRDRTEIVPWLRRKRPLVNLQAFVSGLDANCTVACWKGTTLASITVRVMQTVTPRGPASVIRLVENAEISGAADRLVRRLGLSGLIGLDFVLEAATGDAYLIEMNPRAPQNSHLQLGRGRDLAGALRAALAGEPPRGTAAATPSETIALFPQEWLRDPASEFLRTVYHDVPWDEPDLVRACVQEAIGHRRWTGLLRQAHRIQARFTPASRAGGGVAERA
jgi:hypothetical protein